MVRKCPHCGARHPAGTERCPATQRPIAGDAAMVGKLVADRYQLVRMLGDGGMGAVYKAADQRLRRFVAIKLLHPAVAQNESSVERFQREARSAAGIGHPNIIDVIDFGDEGGRPYMVMEYLRGRSLSQVIAMDGALAVERAVTIAIHTLAGLHSAHERGILHRDLKPANLMLVVRFGDRNFVKICDFGFAALTSAGRHDSKSLTPERTLVGTPAYAAPERLRGDDRRDPRLDVYSVGVVLYEMLAGRRPFDAPTFRELARKVRKSAPPPLRERRPDLPQVLERVVMKSLAKDREDRWKSAEAFAEALFPFGPLRVKFGDDQPSDSFTMEMMRLKAREQIHSRSSGPPAPMERPPRPRPRPQEKPRTRPAAKRPEAKRPEAKRPVASRPAVSPPAHSPAPQRRHAQPEQKERITSRPKSREPRPDEDETQRLSAEDALQLMRQLDLAAAKRLQEQQASQLEARRAPRDVPTMPGRPRSSNRTLPPPADAGTYYQGRVVLAVLRFVSRKFGERALKQVLDSMAPEDRRPFAEGIDGARWVRLPAVRALVEAIDRQLGQDDLHLVLEAGRAAAEGAFDVMRAVRPPGPPPELLVAEMPTIFKKVVKGVSCEVRRVGRGYGRLELVEEEGSSLTLAVHTLGFLARSLERFGADDVEVNLLSARALGDPQTLIDLSWFA